MGPLSPELFLLNKRIEWIEEVNALPYKPTMLIILDGWGVSDGVDPAHDAIAQAHTPVMDHLIKTYPYTKLLASGEAVGLPEGQMGNSEVGHLNIGAGRVVYQDLTRINRAIATGAFQTNEGLHQACRCAKAEDRAIHFLGLVSDGGVHSQMQHLYALLNLAKAQGVKEAYVHVLLDGRDSLPTSGLGFVHQLEDFMTQISYGKIATVCGRYYSMDRDRRWERVVRGYRLLTEGEGFAAESALKAVELAYNRGETDEFVQPTAIVNKSGQPVARLQAGDCLVMFNYRTDRLRQLSHALVDEDFPYFHRIDGQVGGTNCYVSPPLGIHLFTMTQYDVTLPVQVIFPPQVLNNTLGEVVAAAGRHQLRIAETEKYAHVTFFFNGGVEKANPNEDRVLIPSPKVATYDLQPEMNAAEVATRVNEEIRKKKYDLIVLNYANPDMVGHTGNMSATIKAIEAVDHWVGKNIETVLAHGGAALVFADHGNAEMMRLPHTVGVCTAHSCQPVPCILVNDSLKEVKLRQWGSLQDIAPTALKLMDLPQPEEMTGESLY